MKLRRSHLGDEQGIAIIMVAVLLVLFMSLIGLAIDLGRGYVIRVALGTAADGAALAGARMIPKGDNEARTAATNVFSANFPAGFLGVTSVNPTITIDHADDESNLITVTATATMPTTFMQMAGFTTLDLGSSGQATRRLVDMAFVIDRSGSLGSDFPAVRTASSNFVGLFDDVYDRLALISFSNNTVVHDAIVTPARGFAKATLQSHIAALSSSGNTGTPEGLYQAWNQLRRIPVNNQSGLRVVVLFSDGAPNSFAATFPEISPNCTTANPNVPSGSPKVTRVGTLICGDPVVGQSTSVQGLWDTYNTNSNARVSPANVANAYKSPTSSNFTLLNPCMQVIPGVSTHTKQQGDGGIPTSFPLYDGSLPAQLPLINPSGPNYPNHVQNANNAARNLAQIIANQIRADTTGASRIHIFALGLGNLLTVGTGAGLETGESMLKRIANDPSSPQFDPDQPEGGYFFAGSTAQLALAFEAIRDRIIRISK